MTMGAPPRVRGPVGFESLCTVNTRTIGQDATYAATYTDSTTENVPCTIQASSASEVAKYGGGVASDSVRVFMGFFPTHLGDGSALSIPARAEVTCNGVVYAASAAGSEYSDGLQRVPLEVRA